MSKLTSGCFHSLLKPGRKPKVDKLILAISVVKRLAREQNRFIAFHALDEAEKKAGWELAEILEKELKAKK